MDGVLVLGIGKLESAGALSHQQLLHCQASSGLHVLGGNQCIFGFNNDFECQCQSGPENGNSTLVDGKL
jgi:hypothetical protein